MKNPKIMHRDLCFATCDIQKRALGIIRNLSDLYYTTCHAPCFNYRNFGIIPETDFLVCRPEVYNTVFKPTESDMMKKHREVLKTSSDVI